MDIREDFNQPTMGNSIIKCTLLIVSLIGCSPDFLADTYKDIGTFNTRIEAQNQAINYLFNRYDALPQSKNYQVLYSFRDAGPNTRSKNGLHFNKEYNQLSLETDPGSGYVCRWRKVDRTILEQSLKSSNSLSKIDSLAEPQQPFAQCQ